MKIPESLSSIEPTKQIFGNNLQKGDFQLDEDVAIGVLAFPSIFLFLENIV